MSKKAMLLTIGAAAVMAIAALPSPASAGEPVATCGAVGGVCNATIEGTGHLVIQDDSGSASGETTCTEWTGTATANNNSSTGTISLVLKGCKSNGFSCNTIGAATGEIKTGTLTTHLIYLHPIEGGATTDVGILITNVSITKSCAGGLVKKTITGNLIGRETNPNCGSSAVSHTVVFEQLAAGQQKYKQITTTGTLFDLTSGSDGASDTTTTSLAGEGHFNWSAGQSVTTDC
jgi:hypothetical protein